MPIRASENLTSKAYETYLALVWRLRNRVIEQRTVVLSTTDVLQLDGFRKGLVTMRNELQQYVRNTPAYIQAAKDHHGDENYDPVAEHQSFIAAINAAIAYIENQDETQFITGRSAAGGFMWLTLTAVELQPFGTLLKAITDSVE